MNLTKKVEKRGSLNANKETMDKEQKEYLRKLVYSNLDHMWGTIKVKEKYIENCKKYPQHYQKYKPSDFEDDIAKLKEKILWATELKKELR